LVSRFDKRVEKGRKRCHERGHSIFCFPEASAHRQSPGKCEPGLFYGLVAATRRVAAQGPAAYQKRTPSDRRSVIFSPQASSSLAYARVWRMSAIASLPPFLSTRAASRSAFARSLAPGTL